jgi:hypothetical protein
MRRVAAVRVSAAPRHTSVHAHCSIPSCIALPARRGIEPLRVCSNVSLYILCCSHPWRTHIRTAPQPCETHSHPSLPPSAETTPASKITPGPKPRLMRVALLLALLGCMAPLAAAEAAPFSCAEGQYQVVLVGDRVETCSPCVPGCAACETLLHCTYATGLQPQPPSSSCGHIAPNPGVEDDSPLPPGQRTCVSNRLHACTQAMRCWVPHV